VDPGPISIILLSPIYFTRIVYFTRILYCFPLDTLITFVSSKPVRLTTSSQVGNEVLGCVVCRFRVAASKKSLDEAPYINCPKLSQASKHHLQSSVSPLQERLNLGFLTEGKLAAILIIPSSWGSQLAGHSPHTRNLLVPSPTLQHGGVLLAWKSWTVTVNDPMFTTNILTAKVTIGNTIPWWISMVYGPQEDDEKIAFL
jgi:hypothetical protein